MKDLQLIIFLIFALFTSCNLDEERDDRIVDALDINTLLLRNKILEGLSFIDGEVEARGGKKLEVKVSEMLKNLLEITSSLFKRLDSSHSISAEEFKILSREYSNLEYDFHVLYYGMDDSFVIDSLKFENPKSVLERALFKNNVMLKLNGLVYQGRGLFGNCNWYLWPDYRADISVLKNGFNEMILYPGSYIPSEEKIDIINVKFNNELVKGEMTKIGSCFYLRFQSKLKEKNKLTYDIGYNYDGDSISFNQVSIPVRL